MRNPAKKSVRVYSEPTLNTPILVAAWPGVGNVALKAAGYLVEKLGAEPFASIDSQTYFEPAGIFVEHNLIQQPRLPQSQFYYWRHPKGGQDLIIFVGEAQPGQKSYEFARVVVDFAHGLGVEVIYTFAAALVSTPPDAPRVWAAVTHSPLAEGLRQFGVVLQGDFFVAGMNGLLLGVAREKGLQGVCLLGECLRFLPQVENPAASLALLRVLTGVLGLEVDFQELESQAQKSQEEIARLMMESRKEFIDRFTMPLWERKDEEEKA